MDYGTPLETIKYVYKKFLDSEGVSFQSDLIKPGEIFFALKKFEPTGFKRLIWSCWALLELYAKKILYAFSKLLTRTVQEVSISLALKKLLDFKYNGNAYADYSGPQK